MLGNEETVKQWEKQAGTDCEYRILVGLLSVGISKYLLDGHLTLIWVNDFFYSLIGYSQEEFATRFHNCPDEYLYGNPEGYQTLEKSARDARASGEKGNSICVRLVTSDGCFLQVKLQVAFASEYVDGYQVAYITLTDVTEMMEMRLEQEHTQQTLEQMAHEQGMLMSILKVSVSKYMVNEHHICAWANEYYYQLIGYSKGKYRSLFHNHPDEYYQDNPEGREQLTATVADVPGNGKDQYDIITRMKYEDGSSFWVKLFSYFTDEYIDGYRNIYTVMMDVTELVQMKNEQEMLTRIMEASVSLHLMDKHFASVWVSDFYYDLIGYSKTEYETLLRNHYDEYLAENKNSWNKTHEKVQEITEVGKRSYELFVPLRIPDGSTRWVKITGFFIGEYRDGKQMTYTTMVDAMELMQIQQEKAVAYDDIPGFIVKCRILLDKIVTANASDRITDIFNVDIGKLDSFDIYSVLEPESWTMIEASHESF